MTRYDKVTSMSLRRVVPALLVPLLLVAGCGGGSGPGDTDPAQLISAEKGDQIGRTAGRERV